MQSPRSQRVTLAASLACFAVAGVANAPIAVTIDAVAAAGVAVVGVGFFAASTRRISRKRLAVRSLALWAGFLSVSVLHAVGVEAIAAALPGSTALVAAGIQGLTWATLLSAGASTAFLAFREYGATVGADSPEDRVLDGF